MTYRSLLVLLDHDPGCDARIDAAARLAKSFDCHLVGVAPTGLIDVPAVPGSATALDDLYARAWDLLREQAESAAQRFRDVCHKAALQSFEAVVEEREKAESLLYCAHCSDLVVLTQAPPSREGQETRDMVEQVVLQSARPTLLLPHAGRAETIGRTALVAWDGSREASRALSDALPMLRKAQQVHVLSWNEPDTRSPHALRERLDALRQWLAWQGVEAEASVETSESGVSAAIVSRSVDLQADLIVMGAYGHARWAERLLGGATQDLLGKAAVPLMMTH